MAYESRTAGATTSSAKSVRSQTAAQIIAEQQVEIAIGADAGDVQWLKALRRTKKISGDFSTALEVSIDSEKHGLHLRLRQDLRTSEARLNLFVDVSGLSATDALPAVAFCEKFASDKPTAKLFLRTQDGVSSTPLAAGGKIDDAIVSMRPALERFVELEKKLGVSIPLPESGQKQDWDLLCVAATAILSGVPVRLPGAGTGEVEWPRAFYNRLVQISGPCTLPLAQGVYPFAGIDALTEAVIGPIRLCLELKNCAAEVKAGVQELDANRALVKLEYESVLFLFDRYLKSA